jgi:hypothetical protein
MFAKNKPFRRAGLSRADLLALLFMLGIVAGLASPMILKAQQANKKADTVNHLKMVVLATIDTCDANRAKVPPAFGTYPMWRDKSKPNATAHVHILPWIENLKLYQRFAKGDKGWEDEVVSAYLATLDPSYMAPGKGVQNFAANLRVFSQGGESTMYDAPITDLDDKKSQGFVRYPVSFRDGVAQIVFYATRYAHCGDGGSRYASHPNTKTAAFFGQNPAQVKAAAKDIAATFLLHPAPQDCPPQPLMAHAFTDDGIHVAMGDGSVRFVSAQISPNRWNRSLSSNVGNDW